MSWQQLHDIAAETAYELRHPRPSVPVCPEDGQALTAGADGVWHCPWGDQHRTPLGEQDGG